MKKVLIILLLLFVLCSCVKEHALPAKKGTPVWLVSYKYTLDTVLLKKDILWYDLNLSDKELIKVKAAPPAAWILFCEPPIPALPKFMLEKRVFVIGKN